MKKIYLVHKCGEKYGPFEIVTDIFDGSAQMIKIRLEIQEEFFNFIPDIFLQLGFTFEAVEPEKITITRHDFLSTCSAGISGFPGGDLWNRLCELAEKE